MIQYRIRGLDLEQLVDEAVPGWRDDARTRTDRFIAAGRFDETNHSWSDVKPVFMRLQHDKCAYCERSLAAEDHGGRIEHDLEHFRPKSSVEEWPEGSRYPFPTGGADPTGYYWLAYHLANYAVACKKCNSPLKDNYFPVRGSRVLDPALAPPELDERERPLLVNPVGAADDPAGLVTFFGFTAVPAKKTGVNRTRGKAIIDFFRLNEREELRRERMRLIVLLCVCLDAASAHRSPAKLRREANECLRLAVAPSAPHSACASEFVRLHGEQPEGARAIADEARRLLKSVAGGASAE